MKTLVILFIVSANFLFVGFKFIQGIYEEVNDRLSMRRSEKEKITQRQKVYIAAGVAFAIIGAVLYYFVCASTIKDIAAVKHPVEEPIPYGISAIITSIIFAGGLFNVMNSFELEGDCFYDNKNRIISIGFIVLAVLLVVYLVLKGTMVLP